MVYNNVNFTPTPFQERLRAKFGSRTANAVFRVNSGAMNGVDNDGEVLSFFGRTDSTVNGDRAIPSKRRSAAKPQRNAGPAKTSANVKNPRAKHSARPAETVHNKKETARPAQQSVHAQAPRVKKSVNARVDNRIYNNVRTAPAKSRVSPAEAKMRSGYGAAYAAGERVKRIFPNVRHYSNARYEERDIPDRILKEGRSDIAGSRHAVLKSNQIKTDAKSKFKSLWESARDIQKAEHCIKSTPMPIAYAAIVVICAIMAMVLLLSHSQVSEKQGMIGDLSYKYNQLATEAAKLELKLETRDDIREINRIATESIGMVSSDVAQTKFVSVTADDRVEILRAETEETEGGFSALLSAIGEGIGQWSEYFN